MTLSELKSLLRLHPVLGLRLRLPGGDAIPESFHVTEVGRVHKTFLDCGGTLRETVACLLQVWIGPDHDHRLEAGKTAAILQKAAVCLPDDSVPVEVEYEDAIISQYTIASHEVAEEAIVLNLEHKHTECLAPELCGLPALSRLPAIPGKKTGCGPAGCC